MKIYFLCAIAVAVSAFLTGCSTQINSSDSGSMNIPAMTIGPVDDFRPLYQVDSQKKVKASSDVKILFWLFTWGSDNAFADNATLSKEGENFLGKIFPFLNAKETAAKAAFYKACKEAACDSIVAARYEITSDNYFFIYRKMTVEISGYPAKLSGVETVKAKQYYIDTKGDVVWLDNFVKPCFLFDSRVTLSKKENIFNFHIPFIRW